MSAGAPVRKLFGLKAGEGRRTFAASLFHLGFVAAVVLVKSASNALVVARYDAAALPPLYLATALTTGLGAWLAGQLEVPRRLPRTGLLAAAALLATLGLCVRAGLPGAVTALYLFGEAFATLISLRFWGAASELFDAREGKRTFGILGAAGMAGAIAGGLGAQLLGARSGALGLVPVALVAIGVAVAGGLLRGDAPPRATSSRDAVPAKPGPAPVRPPSRGRVLRYLRGDPYPRALAAMMVLLAALTALADYLFRLRAGSELGEAELASLFGALNLWMGVFAVLFQIGVAGRLLQRFGVFRYLLVTPLASAAAAVACIFMPGVGPAFVLRLVESAGSLSLNPAAFQLLYGPVPDAVRSGTRAAIDGLLKKAGFAAGGALLLVVGTRATDDVLSALVLAVVGLFAILVARTRHLYVAAIEKRLAGGSARGGLDVVNAEARAVLVEGLSAKEPRRVLTSLALLEDDSRFDVRRGLPPLLSHPDERVRVAAIRIGARRGVLELTSELLRLLATDVRRPRDEAALALSTLAPARAREVLAPLLGDPDPGLSAVAIAALLPLSHEGAAAALEARLGSLASSPAERRETARLLGRLGPGPYGLRLGAFLRDPDSSVRRLAAEAAGKVREPGLVEELLLCLGDRAVRSSARHALAAFGDGVVPRLEQALNDREAPIAMRLGIPRVLREVGTDAAARVLLFSNIQDDPYLRYRIAQALSRIHEDRPAVALDRARVHDATLRRLEAYSYYLPLYRDLEGALPAGAILVRAVGDRLDQNLESVFRLLQLSVESRSVLPAWRRFAGGDARERAYAVELLENLLHEELRRQVIPVLERYHRLPEAWGGVAAAPERGPARLLELMVSKDVVLRATAIHTARRLAPEVARAFPFGPGEDSYMSESVIEKVFFLEGVEIFRQSDVDDLAALAAIARERSYQEGDCIFREGDPGDSLFVILEGKVRFEKGGVEVVTLATRDAFGETSLLDGAPRNVRAIAVTAELHVLAIDRQDFLELISDRPELLKGIFAAVARHLNLVIDAHAATARLPAPDAGSPAPDRAALLLRTSR